MAKWKRVYNVLTAGRGWTEALLFVVALGAVEIAGSPKSLPATAAVWIGLVAIVGAIVKFGLDMAIWSGVLPKRLDRRDGRSS